MCVGWGGGTQTARLSDYRQKQVLIYSDTMYEKEGGGTQTARQTDYRQKQVLIYSDTMYETGACVGGGGGHRQRDRL